MTKRGLRHPAISTSQESHRRRRPLHTLGLTVGGISQKPGIHDGQIAIRDYLNLTISFDHDVVDGARTARAARAYTEIVKSAAVFEQRT